LTISLPAGFSGTHGFCLIKEKLQMKSNRIWARALLSGVIYFAALTGQPSFAADLPLTVTPQVEFAEIGKDLVLHTDFTLPQGVSLAADQFKVTVKPATGTDFLDTPYPLTFLSEADPGSNPQTYSGKVSLEWVATVLTDALPETRDLVVTVSAGQDLTGTWSAPIKVDFGKEWDADKITSFIERRGMFLFLLLIFGFGLLMSLSPCIYPMIPITLAVIGAQRKEGTGVVQGLGMSLTYAVGMALVYAIIGYVSATIFSGIIAFLQSAIVMVPIALLLIVLSFSMFGAYTLQAPAWLQDRLGGPGGGGRSGLVGVFFMGMVAGLIASPCVGPFLGGLLLALSTTGNPLLAFIALFIFGMGMSILLIAVGTFPALLSTLPQSGGWMETVNRAMGLLLVAMAFYFLRPGSVLPETVFWPLLGVVTIITAVFMGAFDKQDGMAGWWDRTRKGLGLVAFLAGVYFLAGSFLQHGFIMPSPMGKQAVVSHETVSAPEPVARDIQVGVAAVVQEPDAAPLPAKVPWTVIHTGENAQAFLDEARAKAKAEGKPVMIDFWATWCVYCKKLDKVVWNVPEVVEESLRFVTIKVDATAPDDAEMTAIKEEFKVPGLPRVIFIDSRGKVLHGRTSAFKPAEEMLEVMKSVR
jgi:thiol:disulfide interchange protein DsbD